MKFTIRDLIYVTAITALFAVWQLDRQRDAFTVEERELIEGLRKHKRAVGAQRAQQQGRLKNIDRMYDWDPRLLERLRSSV